MKLRYIAAGACILAASAAVSADEFYIDVGVDYGGNANTANGPTTTGWARELAFVYQSQTIADCGLTELQNGCDITTVGGIDLSGNMADANNSLGGNKVNATVKSQTGGDFLNIGPSNNNLDEDWGITFNFELTGTIGGSDYATYYDQGEVTFYYWDNNTLLNGVNDDDPGKAFFELFSFDIFDTVQGSGGPLLSGKFSSLGTTVFNGIETGEMFTFESGNLKDLYESMASLVVNLDFNTNANNVTFTPLDGETTLLTGDHDGSFSVTNVPEPSTIALMGLGLLGMVGASRRRLNK